MSQNATKFARRCYRPQITTTDFLQALKLRFLYRRRNFQTKKCVYLSN